MHKSIHNHADTAVGKSKPFDPFDPFDKLRAGRLPGTMPGTGRAGRLRTLRAVNGKKYSTSTIRNLKSKICNLLAHFMHINEFYVVSFKHLELSHSGGRV